MTTMCPLGEHHLSPEYLGCDQLLVLLPMLLQKSSVRTKLAMQDIQPHRW